MIGAEGAGRYHGLNGDSQVKRRAAPHKWNEPVNRAELQQLARERIRDTKALLTAHRWSGAYYLAGYTVECALKSCVIRHLMATEKKRCQTRMALSCVTTDSHGTYRLASKNSPLEVSQVVVPPLSRLRVRSPETILLRFARLQSLERAPRTPPQPPSNPPVQPTLPQLLPFLPWLDGG